METKRCTKCKEVRTLAEFSRNRRMKSGLNSWCRACTVRASVEWKRKNPIRARVATEKRKREQRAALRFLKRLQGCRDCGRMDGRLDFDHRPGEEKSFSIGSGLGVSWKRLFVEIHKCDIRCPSCHARRHAVAGDLNVFLRARN